MSETNQTNIRVRFAPSPTGYLHVGGLRTALYNYLFARKHQGIFVLRIEDTDRARFVPGAVDKLIEALRWTGMEYDEGPVTGGDYGPYVQSERLAIYRDHVEILLNSQSAYRCFCTPERLESMRKEQEKLRMAPKYDRRCLSLSQEVIKRNIESGLSSVVRMKVPDKTSIRFGDVVRGDVEFESDRIDDQILMKSDGYPTYHLANVVDDHLMRISNVIRGEEWLSSTPKHVLLYQYFGWDLPAFAHLPLLLNADRSKLSKRQGDVAVEEYRAKGYLPEALVNFVALLGWNPGDEREVFMMEELVREFSLERVGKSGAIFNVDKLDWLNVQHLRRKTDVEVLKLLKTELMNSEKFSGISFSDDYLLKVIRSMKERISTVHDLLEKGGYFFTPPDQYDPVAVKKRWTEQSPEHLRRLMNEYARLDHPDANAFEESLRKTAETSGATNGELIHAVRLAISGVSGGPGVFEILEIIGKDEAIKRMAIAVERIRVSPLST